MNDQASMNKTSTSPDFLGIPGRTDDGGSLSSDALSDVPSEAFIKERIHHGNRWTACKGLLMEYSKSSSIHGIRYLFEVHRPIYEKIFWLVTLSTSLYLGFSLSRDMYRKWQDSPVILTFGDTLVPVHEIPFPTITICLQNKIIDIRTENLSKLVRKLMKQYYNISDDYDYNDTSHYENQFSNNASDYLVKQYYNETDDYNYNDTSDYENQFSNNASDDLAKQYYNETDDYNYNDTSDYENQFSNNASDDLAKQYYNETDDYNYNDKSDYENQFSNNASDFLEKQYYNVTDDSVSYYDDIRQERQLAASLHICENEFSLKYPHLLKKFEDPQETGNILFTLSLFSLLNEFLYAHFNGDAYRIYQMFQEVATDQGICLQFNGMAQEDIFRNDSIPIAIRNRSFSWSDGDELKEERNAFRFNRVTGNWSLEDGYVGQGFYAYPKRTVFASIPKGFQAALMTFSDKGNSYCPGDDKIGYKIYLNSPESFTQTSGSYIQISPDQEVIVSLIPQYVKPTPDLRNYEPRKRQCYFNDERYLRLFRQYSQSNCQTECLVNFTIAQCGCVQFWMPKPAGVSVCGVMDIGCYRNAQTELNLILQNQTLRAQLNRSAAIMCDCMPACTTLEYNFEISRARYDSNKFNEAIRKFTWFSSGAKFKVFFKDRQFMAIKRTVLFSMTTLLANFGSICGLLMGISGLSLIELLYFVSLRLYNNVQRRRIAKKKLQRKAQRKLKKMTSSMGLSSPSQHQKY